MSKLFRSLAASCLMMILFVVKYESDEEVNMEIMFKAGDITDIAERVYNNDTYKKAVKLWLPFLNKRGFLDALMKPEGPPVEQKVEE